MAFGKTWTAVPPSFSHWSTSGWIGASPLLILATVILSYSAGSSTDAQETQKQLRLPRKPYQYTNETLPRHFRAVAAEFDNTPPENPITDDGATLGRVLFYDRRLSANGTTSCASCHQQKLAFTDGVQFSKGFQGELVSRNSMSLINLRYHQRGRFFWDERAASLEQQVLMPIENKIEMGHSLAGVVTQVTADQRYPPLFKAAFGDERIDHTRIARALAQFLRSIVSYRSKYDVGRAQVASVYDAFPNFTEQENYGKSQFLTRGRCAVCHLSAPGELAAEVDAMPDRNRQSAFFVVNEPVANGVDGDTRDNDTGYAAVTTKATDAGKFKVSSLRNIFLTAPYMHDGRFTTVDRVLEHYNWSVRPHPNLDPRLAEISANGLALPEREKVALTEFLKTLTDHALLSDKRFSDPWF